MDLSSSDSDANGDEIENGAPSSAELDERTSDSSSSGDIERVPSDDVEQTSSSSNSCGSATGTTEVIDAQLCHESGSTNPETVSSESSGKNSDGAHQTSSDTPLQKNQNETAVDDVAREVGLQQHCCISTSLRRP